MKKLITFLCMLIILSVSLYALDFGGLIDNTTASTAEPSSIGDGLSNDTKVTAWISSPFDINNKSFFVVEGYYNLGWSKANSKVLNTLDLSLVKFSMDIDLTNSIGLNFNLGRFSLSDTTASIFSQPIDGLLLSTATPLLNASIFAGYTGLLNAKTVYFYNTSATVVDTEKVYVLAEKFFLASATVTFPYLVLNQTPTVEFFGSWDLVNTYNRLYMTAAFNGPITGLLFYNLSSTLGMTTLVKTSEFELSNLTKASLSFYPNFLSSSVNLNLVFASGGGKNAFQPFTVSSSSIKGHNYSNLIKGGLSGSIKPISFLLIALNADILATTVNTKEDDKPTYDGFQWQTNISVQPVSDIQITGSFGQFIPKTGESTIQFSAKATLSL